MSECGVADAREHNEREAVMKDKEIIGPTIWHCGRRQVKGHDTMRVEWKAVDKNGVARNSQSWAQVRVPNLACVM